MGLLAQVIPKCQEKKQAESDKNDVLSAANLKYITMSGYVVKYLPV